LLQTFWLLRSNSGRCENVHFAENQLFTMKNTLVFALLALTLLATASRCAEKSTPPIATPPAATQCSDQAGTVKLFICSRGCYQYLLETNLAGKPTLLYPDHLADEFKVKDLAVRFSGTLRADSMDVLKPAPNDAPVFAFKARKITLEKIAKQ
jgi:hypothetical protein